MWTISDVITQAREIVQDVDSDRHTDEKLVGYLNNAIADARRLRPDLFLPDTSVAIITQYTAADLASPPDFPIEMTYFTAVVEYIAGFVGLGDDEFAQDNRAVALLNRFAQKLSMKGA